MRKRKELSQEDKDLGRALKHVLNAVYEVKVGKKTTGLAIKHINTAWKSCKDGKELFAKLCAERGESRTKAVAFEMVEKFIMLALLSGSGEK